MGYESAPATTLLATRCCCCNRSLVDAESVEKGIGPVCRDRHGYNVEIDPESRATANTLVHYIAANPRDVEGNTVLIMKIRELGLVTLADTLAARIASVIISEDQGILTVETPYNPAFVAAIRAVPGRRWDPTRKVNTVPTTSKGALWAAIKAAFTGEFGWGPKGAFQIA